MVSSYLVCDVCGKFGPPASFLSEDGLRLCYQCWYQEYQEYQEYQKDVDIDSFTASEDSEGCAVTAHLGKTADNGECPKR